MESEPATQFIDYDHLFDLYQYLPQVLVLILLLYFSGKISGTEVAYLSLNEKSLEKKHPTKDPRIRKVKKYLQNPKKLLAVILVTNNFINVGIVMVSSYLLSYLFKFDNHPWLGFLFNVVLVTFIILLVGEIIPKVQAHKNPLQYALNRVRLLKFCYYVFGGIAKLLMNSSRFIEERLAKKIKPANLTLQELSDAIDLTHQETVFDEKNELLKNIVSFGNKEVKEVMTPRVDMITIGIDAPLSELKELLKKNVFSRVPVIENSIDDVKGIIYVKDLLKLTETDANSMEWVKFIQTKPYFVPQHKKINDLLNEFRDKKTHIALVVDEYDNKTGLITMEDVLEEIVGEIDDEFDPNEPDMYRKLSDKVYVFEGKIPLTDFFEVFELSEKDIAKLDQPSETLAGLVIELTQDFPKKLEAIETELFTFTVLEIQARRIISIKVEMK